MEQMSLFDNRKDFSPLATRLRPESLESFVGQKHLLGKGKMLRNLIEKDQITSMIFWGPPGVGKTTLARIIATQTQADFTDFSAVTSGIREIREVMAQAETSRRMGRKTLLFIDEIHRFNKAQQDAFLPYVEKGSIVLIGATTENPSFEINAALLSRCKVFVLKMLEEDDLLELLHARTALNTFEMAVLNGEIDEKQITVTDEALEQCITRKSLLYDKKGEEHYNIISALHKSMRNSDPDAALYWMTRMLEGGEDPLYIARRLIRFASEDVGTADPAALQVAVAAYQASHFIGMPECNVNLAEAVVYLSMAPKSNALYLACEECKSDVKHCPDEPVPLAIRNAPTSLMKDLHYGEGYQYAHNLKEKVARMQCLPDALAGRRYYHPTCEGQEEEISRKLEAIRKWKEETTRPKAD